MCAELHTKRATRTDGDRDVESAMRDAQLVEVAERLPREIANLWIVSLGLKFVDHDERHDHGVLGEANERARVCEQH